MDITAANAVIMLNVPGLFDISQQLTQFSADNVYDMPSVAVAEVQMGVDGNLTGGAVNNPREQSFELMADSPSVYFFDQIALRQQADLTLYRIRGTTLLTSVGTKWTMSRGILRDWVVMPAAGRVLKSRRGTIVWQSVVPSPA